MTADPSPWRVPAWLERSAGWTWRLLILAAGVVVTVWLLGLLRLVLVPVLVGLLLAALAAPLANAMIDRGVPRIIAAWATLLLAAGVLVGVGWLTIASVGQELSDGAQWDRVRTDVRQWLRDGPLGLSTEQIRDFEQRAEDAVLGGIGSVEIDRVRLIGEIVGAIFLTIVLFFFFVKDGPSLWRWITVRVRAQRRGAIDAGGRAAFDALQGYMRGVAITGLIDAVLIGAALWIIGVPLVLPLAILTFFGAFFPIVGATLAGALAAVVALVVNGPGDAVLVVLVTLAVQQIEGDLIMPLVMRRRVRLHPLVILVSLAVGGALAGIVGAFVAVPLAAMISAGSHAIRTHEVTRSDLIVVDDELTSEPVTRPGQSVGGVTIGDPVS